jgi:hypothetical protein
LSANLPWLHEFSWDIVTAQNAVLCAAKNALHKATSEGYAPTKQLWESNHQREMSLYDAVDLARRCHRMAPFCFYNGNTFASIVALLIRRIELSPDRAYIVRSLAGHIVAGVATDEEVKAFREFCDGMV